MGGGFGEGRHEGEGAGETYVPSRSTIKTLRGIMPSLAVAAEEENLVFCFRGGVLVQFVDVVVEALPLRQFAVLVVRICVVGAVDQAEVVGCLFILQFGSLIGDRGRVDIHSQRLMGRCWPRLGGSTPLPWCTRSKLLVLSQRGRERRD